MSYGRRDDGVGAFIALMVIFFAFTILWKYLGFYVGFFRRKIYPCFATIGMQIRECSRREVGLSTSLQNI